MASDILFEHKRLAKELEEARAALREAEKSLLANERQLLQAIRENPLMRHMGLVGPESDLSDYLGSEMDYDRPCIGRDAPQEIRPKKAKDIDPILQSVVQEDPTEQFFTTIPCFELSSSLREFAQTSIHDLTKDSMTLETCKCRPPITNAQELATVVPEDAMRATFALYATSISVWDWNAVTGEVYTCPQWEKNIGKPQPASPVEMLTSGFDPVCEECILEVMISLGEAESDSFGLCVRMKKGEGKYVYFQLRGICVRGHENEMLRILVTATEIPQGYCKGGK